MPENGAPERHSSENQDNESIPQSTHNVGLVPEPAAQPPGSNRKPLLLGGIGAGVVVLIAIVAVGAFLALGGNGGSSAGGPLLKFLPDEDGLLIVIDVQELLFGPMAEVYEEILDVEDFLPPDDELSNLFDGEDFTTVGVYVTKETDEVVLLHGDLDFEGWRDELDKDGVDQDTYRGYEIWKDSTVAIALLEDEKLVMMGEEATIKMMLNNRYRGGDSLEDSENSDLRVVLDSLEGTVLTVANSLDGACEVSRCRAFGAGITGYDHDTDKVQYDYTMVFSSERAAESAADEYDEISDFMESSNVLGLDLVDAENDGALTRGSATVPAEHFREQN